MTTKQTPSSAAVARAYKQVAEEGIALRAELSITNAHLGIIAGAIQSGGKFITRWGPVILAAAITLAPTASKVVIQQAQNAGLIQ